MKKTGCGDLHIYIIHHKHTRVTTLGWSVDDPKEFYIFYCRYCGKKIHTIDEFGKFTLENYYKTIEFRKNIFNLLKNEKKSLSRGI